MFNLRGGGQGGFGSDGKWVLTEVLVQDEANKPLSVGGQTVTSAQLVAQHAKAAGEIAGSLTFSWDGNTVRISSAGGSVYVTLNSGNPQPVSKPMDMHLDLSKMACCVGDGESRSRWLLFSQSARR